MKKFFLFSVLTLVSLFIWAFFIEIGLLTENLQQKSKWPFKKIKIAFFSDLHAGAPKVDEEYIRRLVLRINSYEPDLILIGGDFVINGVIGGNFMEISNVSRILSGLKAPLGKYAVLGNHDWWNDAAEIKRELIDAGIKVLENENRVINLDIGQKFNLIGLGDRYTDHSDPSKAFSTVDPSIPNIVFMHDPASIFEIKEEFFLSLAGHTHGGQLFIPGIGAIVTPGDAPKSWAKGWTKLDLGALYVSQGIGTSILPFRLNSPPEFLILELGQ